MESGIEEGTRREGARLEIGVIPSGARELLRRPRGALTRSLAALGMTPGTAFTLVRIGLLRVQQHRLPPFQERPPGRLPTPNDTGGIGARVDRAPERRGARQAIEMPRDPPELARMPAANRREKVDRGGGRVVG